MAQVPENVVDLVSTPPPPSPTTIVEEQAQVQYAESPPEEYQCVIPEALRAKVAQDA